MERSYKQKPILELMVCSVCGIEKPISEFNKDRYKANGYHTRCRSCTKEYKKQYRQENKVWLNADCVERARANRPAFRARQKRYKSKPEIKVQDRLRGRLATIIRNAVKNGVPGIKVGSAVRDLGCTIPEFMKHLESKFYDDPKTGEKMTWEKRGTLGWHVDHIKPLSSFNLFDREQFLQACHYTNLQPLWWHENIKKSNKENSLWR